ncbi:glutaredoxin family protein [Phytohalomonas tamaricis]|uniref:glutaredoxin family protein n=1 Tax=Phytohalomonas tamaricis TaxID=2081032 RepID=UPI000D0B8910|nr:glutaredoxin [Phytohalomonas tamaricis]
MFNKPAPIERSSQRQSEIDLQCQNLALYQYNSCPFCRKVRGEIERLALPIEMRDVMKNPEHRQALMQGGGRTTVPCLQITHDNGKVQWMYESDDINRYLRERFSN